MIWVSIWRSLTLHVAFLAFCPRFESLFYAFIDRYLPDYVIRVCRQRRLTDSWQPALSVIQTFNFERIFGNFSQISHSQMLHTPRATSSESSSKECSARAIDLSSLRWRPWRLSTSWVQNLPRSSGCWWAHCLGRGSWLQSTWHGEVIWRSSTSFYSI